MDTERKYNLEQAADEIARRTGFVVKPWSLRYAIHHKRLRATRFGRLLWVSESALSEWIAANKQWTTDDDKPTQDELREAGLS